LRKLFEDLRKKSGYESDGVFDWIKPENTKPDKWDKPDKPYSIEKKASDKDVQKE
jgi:hypothetical protein